ncbi:MAG TPA: SDR family oxidoreductase [Longimicrobiales bacterium]|nr:SDR family oxidoreductase [Longimicrobiales bacterium]
MANVVVTGATRGIGLAIGERLRQRGDSVAAVARSGARFAADVGDASDVERVVAEIRREVGEPDILINAAGAFGLSSVAETDIQTFDSMIDANLRGPFLMIRALLPTMLERKSGHIVSIGSIAGRQAFAGNGAYSASKYGLRGLHEVLEQELRGSGVRITLIEPAATDTSLWDSVDYAKHVGLPERSAMLSADQVADAVVFVLNQPADVGVKYLGIERS